MGLEPSDGMSRVQPLTLFASLQPHIFKTYLHIDDSQLASSAGKPVLNSRLHCNRHLAITTYLINRSLMLNASRLVPRALSQSPLLWLMVIPFS